MADRRADHGAQADHGCSRGGQRHLQRVRDHDHATPPQDQFRDEFTQGARTSLPQAPSDTRGLLLTSAHHGRGTLENDWLGCRSRGRKTARKRSDRQRSVIRSSTQGQGATGPLQVRAEIQAARATATTPTRIWARGLCQTESCTGPLSGTRRRLLPALPTAPSDPSRARRLPPSIQGGPA